MRAIFSVLLLLISLSCSKESAKKPSVSSGDLQGKKNSQEFVKALKEDLSPELVITSEDLDSWVSEGLITQEEANNL